MSSSGRVSNTRPCAPKAAPATVSGQVRGEDARDGMAPCRGSFRPSAPPPCPAPPLPPTPSFQLSQAAQPCLCRPAQQATSTVPIQQPLTPSALLLPSSTGGSEAPPCRGSRCPLRRASVQIPGLVLELLQHLCIRGCIPSEFILGYFLASSPYLHT